MKNIHIWYFFSEHIFCCMFFWLVAFITLGTSGLLKNKPNLLSPERLCGCFQWPFRWRGWEKQLKQTSITQIGSVLVLVSPFPQFPGSLIPQFSGFWFQVSSPFVFVFFVFGVWGFWFWLWGFGLGLLIDRN